MTDRHSISVIICANDTRRLALIYEAIASIAAQTRPPVETILVIDNNPALYASLTDAYPQLTVTENARIRGLCGARNTAVDLATGDIVAFLDDDAVASPTWLEQMCHHFDDDIRVLGAGGLTLPKWPDGRRPNWFPAEFDWVVGCTHAGWSERPAEIRNPIGCNMSFRRSIFELAGGFEEDMGRKSATEAVASEETEFCIRVATVFPGCRFLFEPTAVVRHTVSPNRTKWAYFQKRCVAEGRGKATLVAKRGNRRGLATERTYVSQVLPAAAARCLFHGLRHLNRHELAQAAAIVAGFWLVAGSYVLWRAFIRQATVSVNSEGGPIQVLDIDLDGELQPIAARQLGTGRLFRGAHCLVRKSGRPVGVVEFPLYGTNVQPSRLGPLLQNAVGQPAPLPPSADVRHELPFARVIVATRDRPETLARCLDSILAQDYPSYELVVVDNAPSDNRTFRMLSEKYGLHGPVRYVREDRPGLGRAHNAGLFGLQAQVVAITDDDVTVDQRWLHAICKNFAASEKVGAVTGLILPAELETRGQYWTECHGGFGKGFDRVVYNLTQDLRPDRLFPYAAGTFGSGANMSFSASALRAIGGFDDALGAGTPAKGGDDLAAFVGVIRSGYQLVYEPSAIVWHLHRRSEEDVGRQAYAYGVGLGAYLTKLMVEDPKTILNFICAAPWAFAHVFSSTSKKNRRLPDDFPGHIRHREQLGILIGMPSYLFSRYRLRRSFVLQGKHVTQEDTLVDLSAVAPKCDELTPKASTRLDAIQELARPRIHQPK